MRGWPVGAALLCLVTWAPVAAAAAPATAATQAAPPPVDYASEEPPEGRSWRTSPPSPGPLERSDAEATVAAQERQLVWPLVRMLMVLVGIVLLMVLLARGARSLQTRLPGWVDGRKGGPQGPRLTVVERLALGPKHTLAWVERDEGDAFLVAWGEGGTSLLGPLARGSRPSFAATMAEVTHEPPPPPSPAAASRPGPPGA